MQIMYDMSKNFNLENKYDGKFSYVTDFHIYMHRTYIYIWHYFFSLLINIFSQLKRKTNVVSLN